MDAVWLAFQMVASPATLLAMLFAGAFGMFVGAVPGLDGDHGHRAAGADHVLPRSGARGGSNRHRDRHGDLRGRHPRRVAAHSGHAGVGCVRRRVLRNDEKRPGGDRARHRAGVFLHRWAVRHRGADRGGAGVRRSRNPVQFVRVFLAGRARPDVRGIHHRRQPGQRTGHAVSRPADRLRGSRQPGRLRPLHVRQHRPARRREPDPRDDRHVCDLRDPALHADEGPTARVQRADRLGVQRHVGFDQAAIRCRRCAAAWWAPRSASCPARAPTWRPG